MYSCIFPASCPSPNSLPEESSASSGTCPVTCQSDWTTGLLYHPTSAGCPNFHLFLSLQCSLPFTPRMFCKEPLLVSDVRRTPGRSKVTRLQLRDEGHLPNPRRAGQGAVSDAVIPSSCALWPQALESMLAAMDWIVSFKYLCWSPNPQSGCI